MTALLPPNLDYTTKDFSSIRRRLFQLIQSAFPAWSDTDVADFGNILVELFAFAMDLLTFYQDRQALESRWSTALVRKNLIGMAKLIGFVPEGASAATAVLTFTLTAPAVADVVLPSGTLISTVQVTAPVVFQLLTDLTLPAGQTTVTATAENSAFQSDTFTSAGTPNQSFRLSQTPYLDGSAQMSAANGTYTEVTNFLDSAGSDLNFTVVVDENDYATLETGDDVNGAIPQGSVTVTYKTGGGAAGDVNAGTLTKLTGPFFDNNGNMVSLSVTNAAASSGGYERQSVEQIRELAPASVSVPRSAIAREDFEVGALGVPGVACALHLTSNEDPSIPENSGYTFIVTDDGSAPSQTLLTQVQAVHLPVSGHPAPTLPTVTTYRLVILPAPLLVVTLSAKVFRRPGWSTAATKAAVQTAWSAFFAILNPDGSVNTQIDFGFRFQDQDGQPANALPYSLIYDMVLRSGGVSKIGTGPDDFLVNGAMADVQLGPKEFPTAGAITLIDGSDGLVM